MNHTSEFDDDERERKKIIPDGSRVRVSMMALDSVQQQIANLLALDERVRDNIAANQSALAGAQRDADRTQAFADYFTAQRETRTDDSAYGKYCQQLSDAWRQVPA